MYKSGDIPPEDFNFEDMQDPHSMLSADALASTGPTNLNLYPRKKELERQMAAIEAELGKSQKELLSLNQMMETYQNQPKFGNSKRFQVEIQKLHASIAELEGALTSIRAEHVSVSDRLEALRIRQQNSSPLHTNTNRLRRGNSTNSSVKSSNLSINSANNRSGLQLYDIPQVASSTTSSDDYDEIPPPPPGANSDTMSSMSSPSVSSSSSHSNASHEMSAIGNYPHLNFPPFKF